MFTFEQFPFSWKILQEFNLIQPVAQCATLLLRLVKMPFDKGIDRLPSLVLHLISVLLGYNSQPINYFNYC